ncbi:MAG: IS200/IS605 family transposase [Pirellulales bacterium]
MGRTHTKLDYHVVFSTKSRVLWISEAIECRVWEYLGGIAKRYGMHPYRIGGVEDHVHLALGIPPTLAVSRALQLLKGGSSRWIGESFPKLREFAWQDGYGAFTVSKSILPSVENYILQQRQHHQKQTFQDEFRELLTKHGIAYVDQYLWG